ncbi:uncharacterized protein [Solanum tuberosum]|uniref:uncharacterized protein n=1 Tax=Solanum tuberosum TaxID=4113 RepID=UPI00073A49B2|nr:PREDICTED: uncharacterized protein LOC107060766 [Solanum tuberosum]
MRRASTHTINNKEEIKVGPIKGEKNQEDINMIGLSKMITRKRDMIMRRTIITQVKAQNQVEVQAAPGKVNSHVDAIKILEGQLSLLSAQLTSKISMKDDERGLAVVTRRGKVEICNVMGNEDTQKHEEGKGMEEQKSLIQQNLAKELEKEVEQLVQISKVMQPLPKIPLPFPQRLKNKNEDEKFKKFLSVFQKLSISLSLVEELLKMSGYAKFMKEIVTKKRNLDCEAIEVSHSCIAIMTKELITKREDPGAFTIPCTIDMLQFAKALYDLGASIKLIPYAIYNQLGLGEPKATTMRLLMAKQSIKYPVGILYDILVKVDRFIFSTDFVILDCEIDAEIPIILGRAFLATGRALVVVKSGKLKFWVNDDEGYEEVVAALTGLGAYSKNPIKFDINLKNTESPPAKSSTEEPPNQELKVLPVHLQYTFLGENNTLLVIIIADFLEWKDMNTRANPRKAEEQNMNGGVPP